MFDGGAIQLESPIICGRDKFGHDRGYSGYRRPSELTANDLDVFRARYASGISFCKLANEFALSAPQSAKALAQQLQLPPRTQEKTGPTKKEIVLEAVRNGCRTAFDIEAKLGIPAGNASGLLASLVHTGQLVRGDLLESRSGRRGNPGVRVYELAPPKQEPTAVEKYKPIDREEREIVWTPQMDGARVGVYKPRYGFGLYLNNRSHWIASDVALLKLLISRNVRLHVAANMLGRSPQRIREAVRRLRLYTPKSWREPRKVREARALLSYPYVRTKRPENETLLAVNGMVAKAYPEHMRADICQDIMLAILEGVVTLDGLRQAGVKQFIALWRKQQCDPYSTISLDAPRYGDKGSWHDTLSADHEVWAAS